MTFKKADIEVTLVDHMGSDNRVVDAARVSFNKLAENYTSEQNTKLIGYLATNNHWSPFAHCFATFRVKAPLFVARQLQKHTVGLSWNEVSRRYVDDEPEFFVPDTLRGRADNVKQGSSPEAVETPGAGVDYPGINFVVETCLGAYKGLLNDGVAPELARMVLPQNTMTEWVWSGSLAAFSRVCKLRLDPHSQAETAAVATFIDKEMVGLFPISWEALKST